MYICTPYLKCVIIIAFHCIVQFSCPPMDAITFERFTFVKRKYMYKSWVYVTERDGITKKNIKKRPHLMMMHVKKIDPPCWLYFFYAKYRFIT